jgi:hypothetical protein
VPAAEEVELHILREPDVTGHTRLRGLCIAVRNYAAGRDRAAERNCHQCASDVRHRFIPSVVSGCWVTQAKQQNAAAARQSIARLRESSTTVVMMVTPIAVAMAAEMRTHADGAHVNADAHIGVRNCRCGRDRQRAGKRKAEHQQRFSGFYHIHSPLS